MKKEKFNYQLRSGYVTKQNLESLIDLLNEVAEEDNQNNKSSYKRKPSFSFSLKNGYECEEDEKDSFIKKLEESKLNLLESLNLKYYGSDTSTSFSYRRGFFDYINATIETNDAKNYAFYRDRFLQLTGQGNINWVVHNILLLFIFYIIGFFVLTPMIYVFFKGNSIGLLILLLIYLISWFLITGIIPGIYPKLIIDFDKKRFGRSLKEDLWKIISIIVIAVLIPIILKRLGWI